MDETRNLLHGKLLDFEEHEDLALFGRQSAQNLLEPFERLVAGHVGDLCGVGRLVGQKIHSLLSTAVHSATEVGRHPETDTVEKGAKCARSVESLELLKEDHEDLLARILNVRRRHAEAEERTPNPLDICLENLDEWRKRALRWRGGSASCGLAIFERTQACVH